MRIVQVADRNETTLQHLAATLPRLHEPLGGVLGTHVPVVADAEDFMLYHRGWAAALTVLLYGLMLVLAGRAVTSRSPALLLVRGRGARSRGVPVPGALGPAHDPPADAALSPGGRARGLGRLAARHVAAGVGAGARARLAAPDAGHPAAGHLAAHRPGRCAVRARGPAAGADPARRARRATRLRLLRPGVPPHLGERRADRGLAALERPLPPLAAAAPRRGALRQERGVGADAVGAVGAADSRRVRPGARPPRRPLAPGRGRCRGRVPGVRAALRAAVRALAGRRCRRETATCAASWRLRRGETARAAPRQPAPARRDHAAWRRSTARACRGAPTCW